MTTRMRRILIPAAALAAAIGLAACETGEDALARGDRLWAQGNHEGALAEYRLALQQSGGDVNIQRRVAHAYIERGDLIRARESYDRLVTRAPQHMDQAVYDYVRLAMRRHQRGDRHGMAAALEAAFALRPHLRVPELEVALGRHYRDGGDPRRALGFYERALATTTPEEAPNLLFEIGQIHQSLGACNQAIGYFEAYRARAPRGRHASQARWHLGQCAFELGREARQQGQLTRALGYLEMVLDAGVPEGIQDQAWFERGEVLFALGQFDEAQSAYQRVLDLNPARTGQLVERAQRRIQEIRFGW
jgi:tetratricopeptide (TPR) repeat protein